MTKMINIKNNDQKGHVCIQRFSTFFFLSLKNAYVSYTAPA